MFAVRWIAEIQIAVSSCRAIKHPAGPFGPPGAGHPVAYKSNSAESRAPVPCLPMSACETLARILQYAPVG
jgi:hypothetical protein